jgi:hypothetical protein
VRDAVFALGYGRVAFSQPHAADGLRITGSRSSHCSDQGQWSGAARSPVGGPRRCRVTEVSEDMGRAGDSGTG